MIDQRKQPREQEWQSTTNPKWIEGWKAWDGEGRLARHLVASPAYRARNDLEAMEQITAYLAEWQKNGVRSAMHESHQQGSGVSISHSTSYWQPNGGEYRWDLVSPEVSALAKAVWKLSADHSNALN